MRETRIHTSQSIGMLLLLLCLNRCRKFMFKSSLEIFFFSMFFSIRLQIKQIKFHWVSQINRTKEETKLTTQKQKSVTAANTTSMHGVHLRRSTMTETELLLISSAWICFRLTNSTVHCLNTNTKTHRSRSYRVSGLIYLSLEFRLCIWSYERLHVNDHKKMKHSPTALKSSFSWVVDRRTIRRTIRFDARSMWMAIK